MVDGEQARFLPVPLNALTTRSRLSARTGKETVAAQSKDAPLAAGMQTCFSGDEVWETSHSKGHRFAPTMILLPWGYSYGRISTGQAIDAVKTTAQGHMYLTGLRGRGCWDAPGQTAEIAVAQQRGAHTVSIGSLVVRITTDQERERTEERVTDAHDRSGRAAQVNTATADRSSKTAWRTVETSCGDTWVVQLAEVSAGDVMASCGKAPKHGKTWVAQQVTQV